MKRHCYPEIAEGPKVDIDEVGEVVGFERDRDSCRFDLTTPETIALPLKAAQAA